MTILYRSSIFLMATAAVAAFAVTPALAGGTRDGAGEQKAAAVAMAERSARSARLAEPASNYPHAALLVADTQQGLRATGIRNVDAGALSLGTVQRLSQVFATNDGGQRAEAIAILDEAARDERLSASFAGFSGEGGNPIVTLADLRGVGLSENDLGALTQGQALQISSTLSQHDSATDKELAIRAFLFVE